MSQINVTNLTFGYEGSFDNVFENVTFTVDTDWKLGFIGRNGKGKTTFLRLLLGDLEYRGSISASVDFDYFPYTIKEEWINKDTIEILEFIHEDYELWKVLIEMDLLKINAEVLYRPFISLSHGERTKVMLALLFSRDNSFLLIDEPTNHLDIDSRMLVMEYLNAKHGFLLVSHDRWLLDGCVDHVLVLNRETITVEKGNFSSWLENKRKKDAFEISENSKLNKEIGKLREAAQRTADWADKNERTKIGFDPIKEHDRCLSTRSYIGAKSKSMEKRKKSMELRQSNAIANKSKLLKDVEEDIELKLMPLEHHKNTYVRFDKVGLGYVSPSSKDSIHYAIENLSFEVKKGERIILKGPNGCGKSSIIKSIMNYSEKKDGISSSCGIIDNMLIKGELDVANGLIISYINQDTSFLKGSLFDFIEEQKLDASLFLAVLTQMDLSRNQFTKCMEDFSEGQRKKILIASSLLTKAHLYIWDEPLNYIDVFSRMQIERLILKYKPTMIIVEHDKTFAENVGTRTILLDSHNEDI